ncbi:hypothetical protein BJX62DRAFT_175166 [Aspergillus germanicus]
MFLVYISPFWPSIRARRRSWSFFFHLLLLFRILSFPFSESSSLGNHFMVFMMPCCDTTCFSSSLPFIVDILDHDRSRPFYLGLSMRQDTGSSG